MNKCLCIYVLILLHERELSTVIPPVALVSAFSLYEPVSWNIAMFGSVPQTEKVLANHMIT
jgi:hypothetical protein